MPMLTRAFTLALLCICAPAYAHHALLVEFEVDRTITLEGHVREVTLGHPHVRIALIVEGVDGEEEWMIEGGSHTTLRRAGWRGDEIRPGDALRVVAYPGRRTPRIAHWVTLHNAQDEPVWAAPDAKKIRR